MKCGRLCRPRHCSKCAQPVPKAVYCSGYRDKHNHPRRDSSLDPLTLQSDALTTRPLYLVTFVTYWHLLATNLVRHVIFYTRTFCAASGVRRRGAQDASGSVLPRRQSEGLSSRSVDVAVAVWHQFARYYTTGHFAQLFPPFDSLS